MPLKNLSFSLILLCPIAASKAQAPTPPPPNPNPEVVAGIPVNYDEAKVGAYTLPDPLILQNGQPVKDAKTWWSKRRPEIVTLFETQQYGRAPGRPAGESFEVFDKGTPALDGKAIRKQVRIYLNAQKTGPSIQLLIYLPAAAKKPVPMLFSINFSAVQTATDDPGIQTETVWDQKTNTRIPPVEFFKRIGHIDVPALLAAGFGVATYYYGDIDPDMPNGFENGIRAQYRKPGQSKPSQPKPSQPKLDQNDRNPEDWGTIAAWAWGMSRVQDYFETDKDIDSKRVAIHGISRLGKTVMWAGAHDQRFAAVIASCSGEGGAALSHRNYGETVAHLTAPDRFPYQFAQNYAKYAGFPDKAPFDANLLIALIAPRPLLLQTGDTDKWSDPKGEFLAAVAAGPVYRLLGKQALDPNTTSAQFPAAKQPVPADLSNGLNYYMHDGGHGMVPTDWAIYINFLKQHLHPEAP